jgi:hypothetical protein
MYMNHTSALLSRTRWIFSLLLIVGAQAIFAGSASAASHYVRAGASGSGSGADWGTAYPSLPSTLVRGDTYYIADGNYGGYSFDTPNSGEQYIYIKKATASDHGTETGWNNTYGDGQASFTGNGKGSIDFSTSYWQLLGNQGSGKTNLGFVITCTDHVASDLIRLAGGITNIVLDRINASQYVYYGNEGNLNDLIYGASGGSNLTVSNSYLHDTNWFAAVLLINWTGVVFENNFFENNYRKEILSCRECHNVTWRNNIHKNAAGTGYLVGQNPVDWYIYNNVFYITDNRYSTTNCIFCNWYDQGMKATNIYIYGNTFYNVLGAATIGYDGATNVVARNNVFYGGNSPTWRGNILHDYNWCYSQSGSCSAVTAESHGQAGFAGVFVDVASENFKLRASTDAGFALPSPFDKDISGVNRLSGASWDRGAYNLSGVAPLPAPRNLSVR